MLATNRRDRLAEPVAVLADADAEIGRSVAKENFGELEIAGKGDFKIVRAGRERSRIYVDGF